MKILTPIILALALIIPILPNAYAQSTNEILIVSDESEKEDKYQPSPFTIKAGDTIVWVNKDFGTHTITEDNGLFGSDYLRPDEAFRYTFNSSGTFDYHCKVHPTMTGRVIVS